MSIEQEVDKILKENEARWERLRSKYDPITGKDAPCAEKRVKLTIPDYAIPEQWVPESMMKNKFIRELRRCKTIEKLLAKHPDDPKIRTAHDVEIKLRQLRHKYDFTAWAWFCIKIKPKKRKKGQKGRVRFKLNYPQILVFLECEKLRLAGEPIDIIIDKARQWGGSTFCIFYQTWLQFHWDHLHAFTIAAHEQTASETILQMLSSTLGEYPAWDLGLPEGSVLKLAPSGRTGHSYVVKDETGKAVFPDGQIYIGTAEKPDSLRGKDIGGVHFSEVGVWPNTPEKRPEDLIADIQGGLLAENAYSMQVMESTAKSEDDYFAQVWFECIEGRGGYTPIFIPWFFIEHDTRYIPDLRQFARWLIENKDNEKREDNWKDNGKHYWWLWSLGATLEGINWYRYKRLKQTSYNQAANEMPSTWEESFTSAGSKVFDRDEVNLMKKFVKDPVKIGQLVSDDRRDRGVLKNIRFLEKKNGNLKIWEMPDDSPVKNRYVVAVDIGGPNPTSDYSSVRVLDRLMLMSDFSGTPAIVAEMHYHCSHDDLVYDAIRLAEWYNHARLVIESNTLEMSDKERDTGGDGSQYILDIASEIYTNLYTRTTPSETIMDGEPKKWGFQTNHQTKPKIIDFMQTAIHFQYWKEPCLTCINEIYRYIDDHGKFTAPPKMHDDELMATAILLWVAYKEMPLPKWEDEIPVKQEQRATNAATF